MTTYRSFSQQVACKSEGVFGEKLQDLCYSSNGNLITGSFVKVVVLCSGFVYLLMSVADVLMCLLLHDDGKQSSVNTISQMGFAI